MSPFDTSLHHVRKGSNVANGGDEKADLPPGTQNHEWRRFADLTIRRQGAILAPDRN